MSSSPPSTSTVAEVIASLQGVTKKFGQRVAVDAVSFDVPAGSICGLLGHNGAGKSTVIGLLLGQIIPNAGTIQIDGHDVHRDRRSALARVGAIYEAPVFYGNLSGRKNLHILCEYTGPIPYERLSQVVDLVGLSGRIDDRVEAYSHGMRQRLAIAQALLPDPRLLIFDEPTEGLDPEGIYDTRNLILKLNREWGLTIVVSSHQLSELQQLCDRLVIMREGQLLYSGEWRRFLSGPRMLRLKVDRQQEAEQGLRGARLLMAGELGSLQLAEGADLAAIAAWLSGNGFRIDCLGFEERSLEDFYLDITRTGSARRDP